jgi:hypothetical protein
MSTHTYAPRDASATTATPRANTYPGKCRKCGVWVTAKAGALVGSKGAWGVEHHAGMCPATAPATPAAQPELGYYVRADGAGIKVVQSKRNADRRYGLVFTPRPGQRPIWDYVKGAGYSVADLTPMTAADAAQLGLATGHCIECCTKLGPKHEGADAHTTPEPFVSALIGYGAKCAANNGWPFPKGVVAQRAYLAEHGR